MSCYFGDTLCTLTTLLIMGVLGFMGVTIANRRKISLWGKRVGILSVWGFLACIFASARDSYYLSVQASTNPDVIPGLFAIDSAQSILGSLGGAIIVIFALSGLFIRKQKYRKTVFYVISAIILVKVFLIEIARAGL